MALSPSAGNVTTVFMGAFYPLEPTGGVQLERTLSQHFSLEFLVNGSATARSDDQSAMRASLAVGVKWYAKRSFEGPWVAAHLPMNVLTSRTVLSGLGGLSGGSGGLRGLGTSAFDSFAVSLGGDVLFGCSARFSNDLIVSLAAGPSVYAQIYSSQFANNSYASLTLGLRTMASVGFSF